MLRIRFMITPALVAGAYFAAAMLSLALTRQGDGMAAIWPSSGILLAALLIRPRRDRPAMIAAGAMASMAANVVGGNGWWTSSAFTAANMVEALIALWLIRPARGSVPDFSNPREAGGFCVAVILASGASALTAGLLSGIVTWRFQSSWFVTVLLGMFIVTPLVVTAWTMMRSSHGVAMKKSAAEIAALLGMVMSLSVVVFAQSTYPLLFLPMLALLAATYRLGSFGAASGVLIIATTGSVFTALGRGPLGLMHAGPLTTILFLQFYLLVLLASAFPLAALQASRDALIQQLEEARRKAENTAVTALAAADTDHLTGLCSRRRILLDLEAMIENSGSDTATFSVALLDIDHFKAINDRFGHLTGDEVLRNVASIISATLREHDLVGRFGGEEFLVVFARTEAVQALRIAERLRFAVQSSDVADAQAASVTISIGIAEFTRGGADDLLERADKALYAAKAAGRNSLRLAA